MNRLISLIIPAYNEEANIQPIYLAIKDLFEKKLPQYGYEIIFINDCSKDATMGEILRLSMADSHIKFIDFAKNAGQRNAIKAAIDLCQGDCAISLDCDLQHPVALIPTMVAAWEAQNEIVLTLREEDKKLSFFKRFSSKIFHKLMSYLSDTKIEYGMSDFRLLDRKVLDVLKKLKERDIYWRGMVQWVGYKSTTIPYKPLERLGGETSYTGWSLLGLAIKGIVSFSIKPLHISIYIGLVFTLLSLLYIPIIVYSKVNNIAISGWTSIISLILFFGGLVLINLGIIGFYIGEIFMQVKDRPSYIVKNTNL